MSQHILGRPLLVVTSAVVGLALAAAMAGPASAAPVLAAPVSTAPVSTAPAPASPGASSPSPASSPAVTEWLATPTVTTSAAPVKAQPAGASAKFAPAALTGKRITFTRGGTLAWSSDTFEWYWSGASISSSTAWQADGYIFPNTVTLQGVKRTLAVPSQHNWRGTATIGAGVVTPWGSVDVYQTTSTDYFSLTPGGGFSHSS